MRLEVVRNELDGLPRRRDRRVVKGDNLVPLGGAGGVLGDVLGSSAGKTIVREVVKGIFGTLRRR